MKTAIFACAIVLSASLASTAGAALNPSTSRIMTAKAVWKLATTAAKVRHACGTSIERGTLPWTVNCNEDPISLGGAGTGDAKVDADLERALYQRPGSYLKLRNFGLPSAHGVDSLCSPASDDWNDIDTCLYQLGLAQSKQLFSIVFNPAMRTVSTEERDCRRALGSRVRGTYRKLITNRTSCFKRNGLLGDGLTPAERYDCLAPAIPPTRGIPMTQLASIDKGVGGTINGLYSGIVTDCPDYLEGINFPAPVADPTGGVFGRTDLAQELLANVIPMSDDVLERLYAGVPHCGDGSTQAELGETCDDGNRDNCDGCDSNCQLPACGNGIGCEAEAEECDDGDAESGDGCSPACMLEYCGDGVVQAGLGEQCDDGNHAGADGCTPECQLGF